jgi:dTDP-4-amino-4,6-dideoxygalactose transaminase
MGEPVSILSLARQMIRLAGLRPGRDVPIEIVGLRPGERLEERLHDSAESVEPAAHPAISELVPRVATAWDSLEADIHELLAAVDLCDPDAALKMVHEILIGRRVPCQILSKRRNGQCPPLLDLPTFGLPESPATGVGRLAALGGDMTFPAGVPLARPARPPLERVVQRLGSSYESGILTNGTLVSELEERVADRLGVDHVVAVSSCTSGLILALQALIEDRPGPVVLPSFTFSATGLAVTWNHRSPRFVGCDPESFQISLADVERALDGASALIATHMFGAPCLPKETAELANVAGVPVMFDAAHALGAISRGEAIGRFGDVEVFSLTPTKVLVAGEGGLIATHDADLAHRLRLARNYGNEGNYNVAFSGLNARLSELHAALALESLEMLDTNLDRRRQLAALYRSGIEDIPGISCQAIPAEDESAFKDFTVRVHPEAFGMDRDLLVDVLASEGVETRNYFDPPVHQQTAFADCEWGGDLVTVEQVSRSVVSLPIYPDLDPATVDRIVEIIRKAQAHAGELVDALDPERTPSARP